MAGRLVPRLGVLLAAALGLALTTPFAIAFQDAYGSGEAGAIPLELSDWLRDRGLLDRVDAVAVYDRLGVLYGLALVVLTLSLTLVIRPARRSGLMLLAGLIVLCLGVFGDYAVPKEYVGGAGFLMELIGFLFIAVAIGASIRQSRGRPVAVAVSIGALACMVAGFALTWHIPSGPGVTVLLGACVIALSDRLLRRLTRPETREGPPASPR